MNSKVWRSNVNTAQITSLKIENLGYVTWYAIEREWRGGQYPYLSVFESTGIKEDRITGTDR